ncbi:MAG: hypothetical protein ACOCRZ_03210 [Halothermotrichaceae bacterium]
MAIIDKRAIIGIVLIVLGIFIFLENLHIIRGDFTLFIISAGFFIAYFAGENKRGRIGFLIPASILLMIGIFTNIEQYLPGNLEGGFFFVCLGSAFFLIYLFHTVYYGKEKFGNWDWILITSVSIYLFSIFIFLVEAVKYKAVANFLSNAWPFLLIAAGLVMLIRGFKSE